MSEYVTLLKGPGGTGTKTLGLPLDLLEKARRRVRLVAALVFVGFASDPLVALITRLGSNVGDFPPLSEYAIALAADGVGVVAGAALFLATRSQRLSHAAVLNYALVFEVIVCLIISVANPAAIYKAEGLLPDLTWVTPLIILFALIIPCPPRRILGAALVSALMRPIGLGILHVTGYAPVGGEDYIGSFISPATAAVFAFVGSRVLYGLGMDVAKARRMGSYRLRELLGRGGMGEVWKAEHRMLARPAAVKLIRPEYIASDEDKARTVLTRFEREAQATASMRSSHTIELYDFGRADDGTFYYVMELLSGFDLESLVRKFGPLPPERVTFFLQQICHSLGEAHESGLIHRDIKPANIYVCRYGREFDYIKVLDFGLVTSSDASADVKLTGEAVVTGTPAYMSPEQVTGGDVDGRSDLYAVGCVAFWLLTGRLVFEGKSPMEIAMHHVQTTAPGVSERTELDIPEELERIILSCLEKESDRRPQTADELDRRLADCTGGRVWSAGAGRSWWDTHSPQLNASA